jgi:hypothetical protein
VQSLTLPANRNVVLIAGALVGTAAANTATTATSVSLGAVANIHAIFTDGTAVTDGGFDQHSAAYSATLLGTSLKWGTVPFTLLGPNVADAVSSATVTLPGGNYSTLNMLAAAVNGSQPGQPFTVTYTDGTQTIITQSVSDWFASQTYAGESKALTMAYRVGPSGAMQTGPFYAYAYALPINKSKVVKSLTIPNDGHLAVLSLTLTP